MIIRICMFILNYEAFKETINSDLPIEVKIHIFEADVSEVIYRFWCRVTGGKFERKPKQKRNSCILVTKRGFHPISNFLGKRKSSSITASYLEVYERDCPGNKWETETTQFWYRWYKPVYKNPCADCGKPIEVQKDDTKIWGKF